MSRSASKTGSTKGKRRSSSKAATTGRVGPGGGLYYGVEVLKSEVTKEPQKHEVYLIEVTDPDGRRRKIWRRFGHFVALQQHLMTDFPTVTMLDYLPRKKIVNNFEPKTVARRAWRMNHWLKDVVTNPAMHDSDQVLRFLGAHGFDEMESPVGPGKSSVVIENLVFEGGGGKAIAFPGALEVLSERGVLKNLKRFGGSSSGAIAATMLAVGFTPTEFKDEFLGRDMKNFLDDHKGVIRDAYRVVKEYGYYAGTSIHEWFGRFIAKKTGNPNLTFQELYELNGHELIMTGTCVNKRVPRFYHRFNHPNMPIRDAVRISVSVPFVFAPVHFEGDTLVDGVVLSPYPIWLFDQQLCEEWNDDVARSSPPNPKTLGLKLFTKEEQRIRDEDVEVSHNIKSLKDFSLAIAETYAEHVEKLHVKRGDWARSLPIDTSAINDTQLLVTSKDQQLMLEEGRAAAIKWCQRYGL